MRAEVLVKSECAIKTNSGNFGIVIPLHWLINVFALEINIDTEYLRKLFD